MSLSDLWEQIATDPGLDHLRTPGIRLVPGIGQRPTNVMIVGEAPGATENTRREPFCGVSGRVLAQLMEVAYLRARPVPPDDDGQEPSMGIGALPNCWLTNVVKYRPPGNRTPTAEEIATCRPHLIREWRVVGRPRLVVTVGVPAWRAFGEPTFGTLSGNVGRAHALHDRRTWLYATYHPQYGLRAGERAKALIEQQWDEMWNRLKETGYDGWTP